MGGGALAFPRASAVTTSGATDVDALPMVAAVGLKTEHEEAEVNERRKRAPQIVHCVGTPCYAGKVTGTTMAKGDKAVLKDLKGAKAS